MSLISVNPANNETWWQSPAWTPAQINTGLDDVAAAATAWRATPMADRAAALRRLAHCLRTQHDELARLITREMGKLHREAEAEVEKCAAGCNYFAQHGADLVVDTLVASSAARSRVRYEPLGTVLAIMPWNFPLWQVVRCAAPAILAGNTIALKHASNTMQCALALERLFREADFPVGVLRSFLISSDQTDALIRDARIHAVSLTGSESAGRRVARSAGENLKKCVLELGGSDPFVVLDDADLDLAVATAVTARFQNAGQSCIAAKRFILEQSIASEFTERFAAAIARLCAGDPQHPNTTLAPLARRDLRDALHAQVAASIAHGARLVAGGYELEGPGNFYAATLLEHVLPGNPAFNDEVFGPVAAVTVARTEHEAIDLANRSKYGLGASVWSRDIERAQRVAERIESGMVFINGQVHSDVRLPFGGIKASGYGRELAGDGLREFVNIRTYWTGPAQT